MYATKLQKLVITSALALAALGATPFASAGTGKHPDGRASIIAVRHPVIIAVRHPNIIGVLKHPDFRVQMRKAGGDGGSAGK